MEVIVLAGGFGTRLKHIVPDVPKPMAPVCGRPFLRYILDDLQRKGVERIILATGYKGEMIQDFFGRSYRGMELVYSQEDTPLGTGGALKRALRFCYGERVMVVNGDTYFDVDFAAMEKSAQPGCFVLAAKRMRNFDRYGTLELNGMQVTSFREKAPCREGLINGGIYLLERTALEGVLQDCFSFETEILEPITAQGRVYAFESDGLFIDIGIPEDYEQAQTLLAQLAPVHKAVFFDRDGTINRDIHYLHRTEDLQFLNGIPQFIHKWNAWGYKVIVATNQAGIARGYYTVEDMHSLHRFMNKQLAEYGAHIDAFYYCPHHPAFTGPCRCRKPEPGMLEDAIREFDLDPTQCIFFGDQPCDMESAKRAGIFFVQVR